MGKLQSKHGAKSPLGKAVHRTGRVSMEATECFLVNAQLNRAFEEQIWKKRSSQDLANYNMDESLSELSICLDTKCGHVPLRVELPPQVGETETSRVLKLDQGEGNDDEKGDKANNLSIEEFECGVQFEGTENSKQEWSFTLYDFDGHGRITKEDLASLLKALYDAVGSSIRLPPNGAKTLKLRLTVGQDRTQVHTLTTSKPLAGGKRKENSSSKGKSPQDVKGTTKQQQFSRLNNLTRTSVKCNNQTQDANGQGQGPNPGEVTEGSARKQLSPEDQQQLVELVQENMERNHVKQLRRHHSEYHNSDKPNTRGGTETAMRLLAVRTKPPPAPLPPRQPRQPPRWPWRRWVADRRRARTVVTTTSTGRRGQQQPQQRQTLEQPLVARRRGGWCGQRKRRSPPLRSHDVSAGGGGGNKCDNSKRESENVQRVSAHQQFLQQNHLRSRSFDPQDTTVRAAKSGGGGVGGGGGNGAAAAAEPSAAGGLAVWEEEVRRTNTADSGRSAYLVTCLPPCRRTTTGGTDTGRKTTTWPCSRWRRGSSASTPGTWTGSEVAATEAAS
ncbi:protein naked cuticle homolog 1-like isoform X2 [Pomacea canaliculata]|uniref:protein naked cuticle homolog 1-like isoform X2 n=1 Tax=Pomacea canaliculata TaxID=400727 RepID=UPI000D732FCD|nr:protein naked cuticle homolog 1-like isoform X2 [Pomacea canaliculata]